MSLSGQKITISPDDALHMVSSHIIGTQRNHTFNEVDPSLENGQDLDFYQKLNLYGAIEPNFGDKRKIYRLGGTDIDGWHNLDYPGYHWATEYGNGNLNWLLSPPTSSKTTSPTSPAYWGESEGTKVLGAGVHRILYNAPTGEFSGFTVSVNYPETINLSSISCPNIYATSDNNNVTWVDPVATSNCGVVTGFQTSGPASGSDNFPIGIREIDYRFTDTCGAVAYCSFLVVVNDANLMANGTIPKINKPQNNMMVELPNTTTHNVSVTWNNHEYNGNDAPQYYVPNYDDLSYYLDDATKMNADLSVGINVGSGHPLEAAGLVQHLINTGDIGRVAYFEIGNEISLSPVWGGPKGHPCTPESYATFAAQFVRAMRAVKQDIKIAVMGSYNHDWYWDGWGYDDIYCQASPNWAHEIDVFKETFVDDAKIDYVAYHGYSTYNIFPASTEHMSTHIETIINGTDTTYVTIVEPVFANCENGTLPDGPLSDTEAAQHLFALNEWAKLPGSPLHDIQASLAEKNIQLVNTEYFIHMDQRVRPDLAHSITEAIFTAENMMLAFSENIRAAVNFSFHQTLWNNQDSEGSHNLFFEYQSMTPKPVFWTHKLIAENMGGTVVKAEPENFNTVSIDACHGGGQLSYPEIGQVTTIGEDGEIYSLLINRTATDNNIEVIVDDNQDYFAEIISIIGGSNFTNQDPTVPDFEGDSGGYTCVDDLAAVPIEGLSINVLRLTPVNKIFSTDITCQSVDFKGPEGNPDDYTYTWNFGDGQTGTGLSIAHTYATSGTYTVTLTIDNGNGCIVTSQQDITINVEAINANFSFLIDDVDCQIVNFTGPTGNPTGTTYLWDFGDGNTSTALNPNHTYTDDGSYDVVLTVTDACGNEIYWQQEIVIDCMFNLCVGNLQDLTLPSGITYWSAVNWQDNPIGILEVPSDGILIIEANEVLRFANNGSLKVQPGGRVDLFGTLTSCDDEWLGVELVSGNLKNRINGRSGAMISNAITGINSNYGGNTIINCWETSFLNNRISIKILRTGSSNETNLAYFTKCQFTLTDAYSVIQDDFAQVYLYGVKKSSFRACDFVNNRKTAGSYGILARDSEFVVSDYCEAAFPEPTKCPDMYLSKPSFETFEYGIRLFGGIVNCSNTTFNSCGKGIYASNVSGASYTDNIFNEVDMPFSGWQIGIYMDGLMNGVNCRYNSFNGDNGSNIGIWVRGLGSFNNLIERNYFESLDYGNVATGSNANEGNGLNYLCNTNNSNYSRDFHSVSVRNDIGLFDNVLNQWSPARNTFTHLGQPGSDFYKLLSAIDYHYWTVPYPEEPVYVQNVNINPIAVNSTPCSDNKGPFKYGLTPDEQTENRNAYFQHSLLEQVAKDNVASLTRIGKLEEVEDEKRERNYQQEQKDRTAELGYVSALLDTINFNRDTVRLWMQRFNNRTGDYMLIKDFIRSQEFESAKKVLSVIPINYEMYAEDWNDFSNMELIFNLIMDKSINGLSADEIQQLKFFAESKEGQACYLAREVLAHYDILYPPIVDLPSDNFYSVTDNHEEIILPKMTVSPNPADYNITFDWHQFDVIGDVKIEITNQLGGLIEILQPGLDTFTKDWTTEKVSGSICYYRLLINGVEVDSGNIVINK